MCINVILMCNINVCININEIILIINDIINNNV